MPGYDKKETIRTLHSRKKISQADRDNGMPIYLRYVTGNIIDVSALITTISELAQYGMSVSHTILVEGYFSEKNAVELLSVRV